VTRLAGLGLIAAGLVALIFLRIHIDMQKVSVSSWTEDTSADCAVVLTGGPYRVREGFALLARHQVRHLVITGVNTNTELRDLMTPWDLFWGPPAEKIILEKRSHTTFGNAQQTLPIVEGLGCQRVALITSAVHMFRAYRTFRSSYPSGIVLLQHAVPASVENATWIEYMTEVLKAAFYSLWAF
jgi:uncharacterized SAM-binding protein YcdF (DUF218 family)